MGVSRKCVETWIDRHEGEGAVGLETGSSHPRSTPTKTCTEVEQRVLAARAEHREGPDVDPIMGEMIRSPRATAVRYERDRPGELVHMNVKKLSSVAAPPTRPVGRTLAVERSCIRFAI